MKIYKYITIFLSGIIVALVTAFWFMYKLASQPTNNTVIRKNKTKGKGTSKIDINDVTGLKNKPKKKLRLFKRRNKK